VQEPVVDHSPPPWVDFSPGVRVRRMVEANGTALILYRVQPKIRFALHDHAYSELGVVLSGGGRCRLGDEDRHLRAGDSFYVPPGVPHDFRAQASGPTVLLNVTVPLHATSDPANPIDLEQLAKVLRSRELD
jgi:mannose-6-phosphate isomerase-like protein (cupin superfamily)